MKGKYLCFYRKIREQLIHNGLHYRVKFSKYLKKNIFSINSRKKVICINKNTELKEKYIDLLINFLTSPEPFAPNGFDWFLNPLGVFYISIKRDNDARESL